MPKYKIALLPGDGIGRDVIEAVKIVLDKIKLDAEYNRNRTLFLTHAISLYTKLM